MIYMTEIVDIHEKKFEIKELFKKTPLLKLNDHYFGLTWMEEGYRLHKHDRDEFFLVLEGHLEIQVGDKVHELDPFQGILIEAGEPHKSKASHKTLVGVFEPINIGMEFLE